MFDLKEILLKKYRQGSLAHFYILKCSSEQISPREFLFQWISELLAQIISDSQKISLMQAHGRLKSGHGDILFITKEDSSKNYVQEDFEEFFQFQKFTNLELKQRFIVVENAHLISKLISNKLLKVLEEPQKNTSIIFLLPAGNNCLPTINSRAIQLSIPPSNPHITELQRSDNFSSWIQKSDLSEEIKSLLVEGKKVELIENLKGNNEAQEALFRRLIEWESLHLSDHQQKGQMLEEIKWFETAKRFKNYPTERLWGLIYTSLQNWQK